ncbi:MAG: hypothetical protein V9G22_05890 [Ottowia sp.]
MQLDAGRGNALHGAQRLAPPPRWRRRVRSAWISPRCAPSVDGHLTKLARPLVGDGQQLALALAGGQHAHGDAHGGVAGEVDPGVVGNGHLQVRARRQRGLHDAAVEGHGAGCWW